MRTPLVVFLLCAACVHDGAQANQNQAKLEEAKDDPSEWECREERQTGSMIAKQVCRPKESIDSERALTQEEMYLVNRRSGQRMPMERPPQSSRGAN